MSWMKQEFRGGIYDLEHDTGVKVRIERLHQGREGSVTGEITIKDEREIFDTKHSSRYTLTGTRSRTEVANHCLKRSVSADALSTDWDALISGASVLVLKAYREGEPLVKLWEYDPPDRVEFRLKPFIYEMQPNLVFGRAGLGKSMFGYYAAACIAEGLADDSIQVEPGPVLYLDWETSPDDAARRIAGISQGLCLTRKARVMYRFCTWSLMSDLDYVNRMVLDNKVQAVVIDSAGPACGGDPMNPSAVLNFFSSLRSLKISSLIIGHVTKNGRQDTPFGTVYWENMVRSMWELRGTRGQERNVLGFVHQKTNMGAFLPQHGYRMHVEDGIHFEPVNPKDTEISDDFMTDKEKLDQELMRGSLKIPQAALRAGISQDSIYKILKRNASEYVRFPDGKVGISNS